MVTAAWLALAGCGGRVSCEQVTLQVAERVWDCTGDADLAWGRARRLRHELGCADEDEDARTASVRCATELEALSCAEVASIGDDPAGWVVAAPSCAEAFGSDGGAPPVTTPTPPDPPTGDTGPVPPLDDCSGGGPWGCAVAFGVEGDRVSGAMPPASGALTVEARVRNVGSEPTGGVGFVGFGYGACNGASLGTISGLAAVVADTVVLGGVDVLSDHGWHTVGAVWDGSTWTVVADGLPTVAAPTCMADVPPGTALYLGQFQGGHGTLLGEMDEVRIWSRALTADELGAPIDGTEPSLLAWYPFDDPRADRRVPNAALSGSAWDLALEGGATYVLVP